MNDNSAGPFSFPVNHISEEAVIRACEKHTRLKTNAKPVPLCTLGILEQLAPPTRCHLCEQRFDRMKHAAGIFRMNCGPYAVCGGCALATVQVDGADLLP